MLVTILADRATKGLGKISDLERLEPLEVLPIEEALERTFETDAHFIPMIVIVDDEPIGLRVRKEALKPLRKEGIKVGCTGLVLDVDAPEDLDAAAKRAWSEAEIAKVPLEEVGFYFTRNGYRILFRYEDPIEPELHEAMIEHYLGLSREWGLSTKFKEPKQPARMIPGADPRCKDWTRIFRLPNVTREGAQETSISLAPSNPIALPSTLVPKREKKPAPLNGKVPEDLITRIETAREYLDRAPIAKSGEGGDQTTFEVAQMLTRGAGLDFEHALGLMLEWNENCEPPWTEERLRYKLEQAIKYGTVATGSLYFSKRFKKTEVGKVDYGLVERWSQAYAAGLALDELRERYGEIVSDDGGFWRYDATRGVWSSVDDRECALIVRRYDGAMIDGSTKIVGVDKGTINGAVEIAHLDAHRYDFFASAAPGIAFSNGRYVIGEGLKSHSSEARLRVALPCAYSEKPKADLWTRFLADVLDEEVSTMLAEYVGACLAGTITRYQKVVILEGFGNNGKSTFLNVIAALFPEDVRCSVEPQLLDHATTGSYWRARLVGKAINVVTDLAQYSFSDTSAFKRAVVGDTIGARSPGEKPFDFKPKAGHLFSANELPDSIDLSDGFFRRWSVVKFSKVVPKDKRIEALDERIIAEELAGVAKWALDGAERLFERKHFAEPEIVREGVDRWRRRAEPLRAWGDELSAIGVGVEVPARELLTKAIGYALKNGLERPTPQVVAAILRSVGFEPSRGGGGRAWTRERLPQ